MTASIGIGLSFKWWCRELPCLPINCNVWIAPDDANNDPEGGGLLVVSVAGGGALAAVVAGAAGVDSYMGPDIGTEQAMINKVIEDSLKS